MTPMEVGAFRTCCWYAFAASTPELAPLVEPVVLPPLVVVLLPLGVLLLLHAAIVSADIPAMTTARVFLIPGPPWHALGRTEQPES